MAFISFGAASEYRERERERERERDDLQLPYAPMAVKLNDQPALESDGRTNNCTTAMTRCNSRERIYLPMMQHRSLSALITSNAQAKGELIVSAR